ncbi:hypothetical protein J4217_02150 [Candidatus Pacearchaeota archaeon]|nr:hypothetical protein [Candidatus Pacearchaeota archaeon]
MIKLAIKGVGYNTVFLREAVLNADTGKPVPVSTTMIRLEQLVVVDKKIVKTQDFKKAQFPSSKYDKPVYESFIVAINEGNKIGADYVVVDRWKVIKPSGLLTKIFPKRFEKFYVEAYATYYKKKK